MSILGGNERIAAIQRALDAMTSPEQVKQFMAMHKSDAIAVSMADQKLQQMTKPQATPPQPTVVDQKLQQAAPMQGVAALNPGTAVPAQGYAGGGIIAFARGGDAGEGYSDAFLKAFKTTMKLEGKDKVIRDQGGLTKYGVSQKAHPELTEDQIRNLTEGQAMRIAKRDYWDKIGGDDLAARDPDFAVAAFDTAYNHGVSGAKPLIAASKGDTSTLLGLRQQQYDALAARDPEKHGSSAKGWKQRLTNLAAAVTGSGSAQAEETPKKQGIAAVAPKTTPDYSGVSDDAGALATSIGQNAAAGLGAYEAVTPSFAPGTTLGQAAARTAATAGTTGAVGLGGGLLSSGARNALANATPEQRDQLANAGADAGDTALAAAILNAPGQQAPTMSYGDQMRNVGKFLAGGVGSLAKKLVSAPGAWDSDSAPQDANQSAAETARLARQNAGSDNLYVAPAPDEDQSAAETARLLRQNSGEDPSPWGPTVVPVEDKTGVDVKKPSRFNEDDWLMAGLKTLQAASQPGAKALGSIGEGGIAGLTNKRQRAQDEAKQALENAQMELFKQQGKWYGTRGDTTQEGMDLKRDQLALRNQQAAAAEAQMLLKQEMSTAGSKLAGLDINNPLVQQTYQKYLADAYNRYGVTAPGATIPQAGASVPGNTGGIKVLGVRPSP